MENLGFIIFRGDEPDFAGPGETAQISDGDTISLYHKLKNYAEDNGHKLHELPLTLELYEAGNLVGEHSFSIGSENNQDVWLIADPAATDENGSFTSVFVDYFANASQGAHNLEIKLYVNGNLYQTGSLSYQSDGENAKYKGILEDFADVSATREKSVRTHQGESERQRQKEEEEFAKRHSYFIKIRNENQGKTMHVIAISQNTYSEDWYQALPNEEITLELSRGVEYVIVYFNQDQTRDEALLLTELNDLSDGATFTVR